MPPRALRHLLHALLVSWLAATTSFTLLHLAPGDPITAAAEAGRAGDATRLEARRRRAGLDRPLLVQYGDYLTRVARGDLGWSYSQQRPVRAVLLGALPASVLLAATGLALAFAGGIALGTLQAWRPRAPLARALGAGAVALHAAPEFLIGVLLLLVFAARWRLLPANGMADATVWNYGGVAARAADVARHLVLPALAIGLVGAATVARHLRTAMIAQLDEDHVRTAVAKGATAAMVLRRHVLRPALPVVVVLAGLALPALAGGAVLVELLFGWPGLGLATARAVLQRDYDLVAGAVIIFALVQVAGSVGADVAAGALDPRHAAGPAGAHA